MAQMKNWLDSVKLGRILKPATDALAQTIIEEIKVLQPVDDTTEEKADKIFKETGKYAWIMDDESAIDDWEYFGLRSGRTDVLMAEIFNTQEYVQNLNEGTMNELVNGEPVERTSDGKYSEQSPTGGFIQQGLENGFNKFFK